MILAYFKDILTHHTKKMTLRLFLGIETEINLLSSGCVEEQVLSMSEVGLGFKIGDPRKYTEH